MNEYSGGAVVTEIRLNPRAVRAAWSEYTAHLAGLPGLRATLSAYVEAAGIENLAVKAQALLDAITADNNQGGGLIGRATIRTADELRLELLARSKIDGPPKA